MNILLTNDDGVFAPGIRAMHKALCQDHRVFVAAPETEQSAVGHAITLVNPIKVRPLNGLSGMQGFAVAGTPADCVKLAVGQLMDFTPDLVVSGINQGANVGINVLYSGTVSAATEAAILGLGSMAFSLDSHTNRDFGPASLIAARLVGQYHLLGRQGQVSYNVNIPNLPPEKIRGVRFARQSNARLGESFVRRSDPRGGIYYWQAGESMNTRGERDTDFPLLRDGFVTITPLRHDLTHNPALAELLEEGCLPTLDD